MNEDRLRAIASGMGYPRTPDIAGLVAARLHPSTRPRFSSRRLAWSLTISLILVSSFMLIPPVRAAILEFIQIGVVRIFPPEPAVQPITTATPEAFAPVTAASPSRTSKLIPILDRMAGEITLTDAQNKVAYPILLPAYPSDLGQPDYVYVQDMDANVLILVWLDPHQMDSVLMSLHFIPNESWAVRKIEPTVIEETTVNDKRAIWTTGPYPLVYSNGSIQFERMIAGHVLIWADSDLTYRLETDMSLEEAVKIAESLEPFP